MEKLEELFFKRPTKVLSEEEHKYWLCPSSEARIETAMEQGFTIVVEDFLLMKFEGSMTALCIKSFKARNGAKFEVGNWYSPYGTEARDWFREQYKNGQTKIKKFRKDIRWAKVRPLTKWNPNIVVEALNYSESVDSKKLPRRKARRRQKITKHWQRRYPDSLYQ